MRKKLQNMTGKEKHTYTGFVKRFGTYINHSGNKKKSVLLLNIKNEKGILLTDHVWLRINNNTDITEIKTGDTIYFDAYIGCYQKKGHYTDYNFKNPTNIKKKETFDIPIKNLNIYSQGEIYKSRKDSYYIFMDENLSEKGCKRLIVYNAYKEISKVPISKGIKIYIDNKPVYIDISKSEYISEAFLGGNRLPIGKLQKETLSMIKTKCLAI